MSPFSWIHVVELPRVLVLGACACRPRSYVNYLKLVRLGSAGLGGGDLMSDAPLHVTCNLSEGSQRFFAQHPKGFRSSQWLTGIGTPSGLTKDFSGCTRGRPVELLLLLRRCFHFLYVSMTATVTYAKAILLAFTGTGISIA